MGLLDGKVAIITGAGGGIGREHALLFAKEGAAVVVNDLGGRRDGTGTGGKMADDVVADIIAAGGRAAPSDDSVTTRDGVDRMVWVALSKFGRVDVLINNAGILRDRSLLNMSEEEWDRVLEVHLRGTFLATQAVARVMKAQGTGGAIVNTSSVSGLVGNFGQANYGAAKAGIAGFTFVCAKEFARFNVRVNALAPVALTRMTEDLPHFEGGAEDTIGPQFIAPAALYLASELSDGVTGKILGAQGNKLFEYKVVLTEGVTKEGGAPWTAAEIKDRWTEITT
ncbi:MAG: SDR family NAD(P)-dependent oxidoreductase [Myxococcota bacterium]